MAGGRPPYDDQTFAPYITFPIVPINFDTQIPKKGDQRQMEPWQRIGVYAAGVALANAGVAGKTEILDKTDMIVAAGGGERDIAVDSAILTDVRNVKERDPFVNERLMSDLRPTLFLAQLPNLLAGNISLVHGVVGSSRTFMGEEASGCDALRVAHARIEAGQSSICLVGGAYNGTRWDIVLMFKLGERLLEPPYRSVWDRGPDGALALAAMGAFAVIESRAHAEQRGAKPVARLVSVQSSRNLRRPGDAEATLRHEWEAIAPKVQKDRAVVISGATGAEPATSEERKVLGEIGLPVRATASHIGNGMEAQFLANIGLACQAVHSDRLFAPTGSGDTGDTPPGGIRQALVTSVGHWRGEGLALVERID
jgi:3-oxoacyl-[acyl-carrier-protein] synthase II